MRIVPITLKQANNFVRLYHRHNDPVTGNKFAIGCEMDGKLIGVAIAGRPVAPLLDDGETLEILRVASDGTRNVNSFLYSRCKKIAQLMGYKRVKTYTLVKESGASLRAVGAIPEAVVKAQEWNRRNRPRRPQKVYQEDKIRWRLL